MIGPEQYYYAPNYLPYSSQVPVSDATGAWSASGTSDPIFLNPYADMGPVEFGYGFQPAYNFGFTGTGDYATWTGIAQGPMNPKPLYDEYYQQMNAATIISPQDSHIANEHLSKLENGISNLNLGTNMTPANDITAKESHNNEATESNGDKINIKDNNNNNNNNNTTVTNNCNDSVSITPTNTNTNATTSPTTLSNTNNNTDNKNNYYVNNKQKNKLINNTNNNNNNKSWASVVCPQSFTSTTASNKKVYSQNQNMLQNNSTNVITTYAVNNSAILSPNRQQYSQAFNNQYLSNPNNYSNYRQNNYQYYNQQSGYYQGSHYSGRNRGGQSYNPNSNFNNNYKRNNNNNAGIYTTSSSNKTTTINVSNTPSTITSNNNNNLSPTIVNLNNDNNLDNSKNDEQNTTASSTNSEKNINNNSTSSTNNNNNNSNNNVNNNNNNNSSSSYSPQQSDETASAAVSPKFKLQNQYNPKEFNLTPKGARFFVIKSYSEDDVHRSIKYNIWCSTEHGNRRLDQAFREREGKGPVYLFFSVNGSGHFCGMAEMMSCVDYDSKSDVWSQDKWKGKFEVKWIYVKDVPNSQLRNIRLENNENKPVTNSRDTQEIPCEKGKQVLKVFYLYRNITSIFDVFEHYEKRQDEDQKRPVLSVIL